MNKALISSSLYLMWQTTIGWVNEFYNLTSALAQTGHDGGSDKAKEEEKWGEGC